VSYLFFALFAFFLLCGIRKDEKAISSHFEQLKATNIMQSGNLQASGKG